MTLATFRRLILFCAAILAGTAAWAVEPRKPSSLSTGKVTVYESFESRHVDPRKVVVWVPDDPAASDRRHAVLYMHDGQNLFDDADATFGNEWGLDETITELVKTGRMRPTIVVAIWNTPKRWNEYAPAAPLDAVTPRIINPVNAARGRPVSDAYLRFIVEELKPFIDANYPTRPDRQNTVTMGASMGGLISLYALARHPDVFGGAAGVSTHWPHSAIKDYAPQPGDVLPPDAFIGWLRDNLPKPGAHRLYFDHGTLNLDAFYGPHHNKSDSMLKAIGWRPDVDYMARAFNDADHNEKSWRARAHIPLTFLLPPD